MLNLHTKFEDSMFTDYEDMKGRGWVRGHPRSLAMLPLDRAHTTS